MHVLHISPSHIVQRSAQIQEAINTVVKELLEPTLRKTTQNVSGKIMKNSDFRNVGKT